MIQKIWEKLNIQTVIRVVPTALFLLFIFAVMIFTYTGKVKKAVIDTKFSVQSKEELSNSFEETLRDNFYDKYSYYDINGLYTRILGINSLNERQKLTSGQLAGFGNASDVTEYSESVIALNDFLTERGIEFVYILAPTKLAFYGIEFAPGYSSNMKDDFDSMIEILNKAGVTTIYMNAWFEENAWGINDVYFRTDHHWLPQAGLAAANLTMQTLLEEGAIDTYNEELLRKDSYNIVTLKDWFLGSNGKRVGKFYAGIDDIDVYYPNFPTEYAYAGLSSNSTNWTYKDTPLNDTYYIERKNLYSDNTYCMYLYGDYPLQLITNGEAEINKRVLMTGDSFREVCQYFLLTQFKENYYIDLRHYTDGTFVQYVEDIHPDIVIMCSNSVSNNDLYGFGVDDYFDTLENTSNDDSDIDILSDIFIEAQEDNDSNFIVMCDNLEPNQAYTLTLDSTIYDGGDEWYVQMTLQNLSSNKAVYNRYFDANSNETQKWIFTTPEDVAGEYSIYLYAGTKGHTKGVSVSISHVRLREGVFED